MPIDQPKHSVCPTICAGVVLLAVYFGAYFTLVEPVTIRRQDMLGATQFFVTPSYLDSEVDGSSVAEKVFTPIHRLDRRIRPQVWEAAP